jgi:hypothetical protein
MHFMRGPSSGFVDVIHALMHESNLFGDAFREYRGAIFRRYALWGGRI